MIWRILAVILALILGMLIGLSKRKEDPSDNPSTINGTFEVCTDDPEKDIFTLSIDDWTLTHIKDLRYVTFAVHYNRK